MVRITAVVSFIIDFFTMSYPFKTRRQTSPFACLPLSCTWHHKHWWAETSHFDVLYLSHAHFYLLTFTTFRCQCEQCRDENLAGAREFRCCKEVANSSRIMTFDGSGERISCITQHEDFMALTNRTVLLQVAPLLRDKEGRKYRRRAGISENE